MRNHGRDDQAPVEKGVNDGRDRAEFLSLGGGALKGEDGHRLQRRQRLQDVVPSVALFQSEQQAEDFGGEVDPEQHQSHQQPRTLVVSTRLNDPWRKTRAFRPRMACVTASRRYACAGRKASNRISNSATATPVMLA